MDVESKSELYDCKICPRECGVNRFEASGACLAGALVRVASYQLHLWEEPVISGIHGSGTIFFSGCNMHCVYCQNYEISQKIFGKELSIEELSDIMLELQDRGVHNINLVTPSHFTPQIRLAIIAAKKNGLSIPIVWNSNAYEKVETLKTIEGLVDIYMPDFRYAEIEAAIKYSQAIDYPHVAKIAIKEMFRQVGHLRIKNSVAEKGLLIRILVLPENIGGVDIILKWIAENIGKETYISLMGQYYPAYKAFKYQELSRGLKKEEYNFALHFLEQYAFKNGFTQDIGSDSSYTPNFK